MKEQLPYFLYSQATGTGKIVRRKQPEGGFTGNLTRELKYEEYLNSLPSIPVHDDLKKVWQDNGKYYPGKDFYLKECRSGGGDGELYNKAWPYPTTDKPQHQNVGGWIKASDRLPDKPVFARTLGTRPIYRTPDDKSSFTVWIDFHGFHYKKDQVEWYDDLVQARPTHISVDDLIKELDSGNPYIGKVNEYRYDEGFREAVRQLRNLIAGKIITTPDVLNKTYKDAYNKGFRNADGQGTGDYGGATYLKQTFGITL